jgi:hypothetical protein
MEVEAVFFAQELYTVPILRSESECSHVEHIDTVAALCTIADLCNDCRSTMHWKDQIVFMTDWSAGNDTGAH